MSLRSALRTPVRRHRAVVAVVASALTAATALAGCASSTDHTAGVKASPNSATSSATSAAGNPRTANVTITAADGCSADKLSFPAGAVTFKVRNADATAVSEVELLGGERIVGEKENLPPGFTGTFTVDVEAGNYTLYCPGAATEKTPITVTGKTTTNTDTPTAALLDTATKQYGSYVSDQVGYLAQTSKALATALHGSNLTAAQDAYKKARPYYERVEPVAESFTVGKDNLDADIDARAGDVPAKQWRGFHRIEKGLFADKSLAGLAPYGDRLVRDVQKLRTLTTGLTYKPTELANGAQELLDEVASSKITGEEERYSHIDLLDFQGNDEGAEQAFADLEPALRKIDPDLARTISAAFGRLDKLVDSYRSSADSSGFQLYTSLTTADKKKLATAVKAVQEPLSRVASKVANA